MTNQSNRKDKLAGQQIFFYNFKGASSREKHRTMFSVSIKFRRATTSKSCKCLPIFLTLPCPLSILNLSTLPFTEKKLCIDFSLLPAFIYKTTVFLYGNYTNIIVIKCNTVVITEILGNSAPDSGTPPSGLKKFLIKFFVIMIN
jgi:hypothetical protein